MGISGCMNISSDHIRAQIPVAFSIFDMDNSGSISKEELRLILIQGANDKRPINMSSSQLSTSMGPSLTSGVLLPDGKSIDKVMKELDVDKNGRVDAFEFEKYLLKEHERIGNMLDAEKEAAEVAAEMEKIQKKNEAANAEKAEEEKQTQAAVKDAALDST